MSQKLVSQVVGNELDQLLPENEPTVSVSDGSIMPLRLEYSNECFTLENGVFVRSCKILKDGSIIKFEVPLEEKNVKVLVSSKTNSICASNQEYLLQMEGVAFDLEEGCPRVVIQESAYFASRLRNTPEGMNVFDYGMSSFVSL